MEWNGIERMRAAFSGRLPDRVPFLPTIFTDFACRACGHDFAEAVKDPYLGNRLMLEAALACGADGVRFMPVPAQDWFAEKEAIELDGQLVQFDRATGAREGVFDLDGGGAFVPDTAPPPVSSREELEAIPVPSCEELLADGRFEGIAEVAGEARAKGLFTIGMAGGQTLNFMVRHVHDTATALLYMMDDPGFAHAFFAKGVATSMEVAKAFVECGVDGIYIGDSYASASVISPDMYHTFCTPAYKAASETIKAKGVFCYKHCCGNYDPLLEYVPESGIDGMDGLDPTSGMDVARTKAAVGEKTTLMGGISCLTLLQGSEEEVYGEAKECIMAGKPGGRYILGSACAVPRAAPLGNLVAARQAAVDFGGYETNP